MDWCEKELKVKAQMAYKGEGELEPGEWCRFCSIKNRCRKLYEQQMEIAKYEFTDPNLLTDEEVSDIIGRVPRLQEWATSILTYAQDKAVNENKHWPGFKLVEGVSRRKWIDEDDAADAIKKRCPSLSDDEIYEMKFKSISAIEKLVGKKKFSELFSDVVVKPQGKPALVPESDKRPAMGIAQAQIDFAD